MFIGIYYTAKTIIINILSKQVHGICIGKGISLKKAIDKLILHFTEKY